MHLNGTNMKSVWDCHSFKWRASTIFSPLIHTTSKARLWLINVQANEQSAPPHADSHISKGPLQRPPSYSGSVFSTTRETSALLSHTSPFHPRPQSRLTGGSLSPLAALPFVFKSTRASLKRSVVKWQKQGIFFALSRELLSHPLLYGKKIRLRWD